MLGKTFINNTKFAHMVYTWLREFNVDLAEYYPHFKIVLKILPPNTWKYSAPFYTFAINLKVDGINFGWYLYVGDFINSALTPGRELVIETYLKLLDIHALNNRDRWREKAERGEELKLEAEALIYILNYQAKVFASNRVPAPKVLEWVKREGEHKNEFIPLPSPFTAQETANVTTVANVAFLYKSLLVLKNSLENILQRVSELVEQIRVKFKEIDAKFEEIEPLVTIFKHGLEYYNEKLRKEVERQYAALKPIAKLIRYLKKVSKNRLDENWALSALVLVALENIVNLKLKELGEDVKGSFHERVSRLKDALINKLGWDEREASDLARRLKGKYEERHIVVHGGYENPTTDKATLEDLGFIMEVLSKLWNKPHWALLWEPGAPDLEDSSLITP